MIIVYDARSLSITSSLDKESQHKASFASAKLLLVAN